jgi:hypothetical protein
MTQTIFKSFLFLPFVKLLALFYEILKDLIEIPKLMIFFNEIP